VELRNDDRRDDVRLLGMAGSLNRHMKYRVSGVHRLWVARVVSENPDDDTSLIVSP